MFGRKKRIPNTKIDKLLWKLKILNIPVKLGRSYGDLTSLLSVEDFLFTVRKLKPKIVFVASGINGRRMFYHFISKGHTYRLMLPIMVKKKQ